MIRRPRRPAALTYTQLDAIVKRNEAKKDETSQRVAGLFRAQRDAAALPDTRRLARALPAKMLKDGPIRRNSR